MRLRLLNTRRIPMTYGIFSCWLAWMRSRSDTESLGINNAHFYTDGPHSIATFLDAVITLDFVCFLMSCHVRKQNLHQHGHPRLSPRNRLTSKNDTPGLTILSSSRLHYRGSCLCRLSFRVLPFLNLDGSVALMDPNPSTVVNGTTRIASFEMPIPWKP